MSQVKPESLQCLKLSQLLLTKLSKANFSSWEEKFFKGVSYGPFSVATTVLPSRKTGCGERLCLISGAGGKLSTLIPFHLIGFWP